MYACLVSTLTPSAPRHPPAPLPGAVVAPGRVTARVTSRRRRPGGSRRARAWQAVTVAVGTNGAPPGQPTVLAARRTTALTPGDVADLEAPVLPWPSCRRSRRWSRDATAGSRSSDCRGWSRFGPLSCEVRDVVECEAVNTHLAAETDGRGLRVRGEGRSEDQHPPDEQRQCSLHYPHLPVPPDFGWRPFVVDYSNYDECLDFGETPAVTTPLEPGTTPLHRRKSARQSPGTRREQCQKADATLASAEKACQASVSVGVSPGTCRAPTGRKTAHP